MHFLDAQMHRKEARFCFRFDEILRACIPFRASRIAVRLLRKVTCWSLEPNIPLPHGDPYLLFLPSKSNKIANKSPHRTPRSSYRRTSPASDQLLLLRPVRSRSMTHHIGAQVMKCARRTRAKMKTTDLPLVYLGNITRRRQDSPRTFTDIYIYINSKL